MINELNNSYALLIGVGGEGEEYMVDDATALRDVLIDPNFAGYPPENVTLLVGEDASRTKIMKAFEALANKINEESKVLLYYSGHGNFWFNEKEQKNNYYLQLYGYVRNETEKNTEPHLLAKELKQYLNNLVTERLIFFFDCCHAQGMTTGEGLLSTDSKLDAYHATLKNNTSGIENPEGLLQKIDDEEGLAIISACKDHQRSLRFNDQANSLFTTCLLEVLKGENAREFEDPYVRITDVVAYLVEEVPKRAATKKRPVPPYAQCQQNPFINMQFDRNFELSRVPKEKIKRIDQAISDNKKIETEPEPRKEVLKVFKQTENANNAIIFVHGFSGESHHTFGQMPYLLAEEEKMQGWDMYPFGFNPNVNPQMGKEVWATIQDINRISDNLSSAIKYKFEKYDRIAIVAYSLGGLVAQRAILNLDDDNRDRLSHVLLMATPSNGITNNAIKKLWKNKIKDLIQGEPFISQLRSDWSNAFPKNYPFELKVVAATKDEFVAKDSSLEPFDKKHWVTVSGDHFSIANTETKDNDSYHLILDTLTNNEFFNQFTDEEEVNLVLGEYDAIIRKLEPKLKELDERGLEKLIHALDGIGRSDDAIQILKTHKIAQNDSDMLRNLGDIYKFKYLNDSLEEDGKAAFNCYTRAYDIATKNNEVEDIYLSAINLAFLNLMLEEDIQDMQDYAQQALDGTAKYPFNNIWKLATIAEANLYLGNFDVAKEYYLKASQKAGIREKITIYTNAYTAYAMLLDTEDDEFIKFLKSSFLS